MFQVSKEIHRNIFKKISIKEGRPYMIWETSSPEKKMLNTLERENSVLQWLTVLTWCPRQDGIVEKQIGDTNSTSGNEKSATGIYFDVHT